MARLLADRLEEEGESAGAEVSVGALLEEWVPYGVARSSLDLTTKSEYDLLVLEFLADRGLTVLGDPALAEAAGEELETPEPGLGALEEHADVTLRLDLATISGGYRGSDVGPGPDSAPGVGTAPGAGGEVEPEDSGAVEAWDPTGGVEARPTLDAGGESSPDSDQPEQANRSKQPDGSGTVDIGPGPRGGTSGAGERQAGEDADCRSCGEALPIDVDVPVRYCPSCGAARPERACPECGARLRPEWSYCPACGTHASPSGGVPEPEGGEWEPE